MRSIISRTYPVSLIAVYPVDANGLLQGGSYDASANQAASLCLAVALPPTRQARQLGHAESQAEDESRIQDTTLRQVAAETGGKAFVNTNDFQMAIQHLIDYMVDAHHFTFSKTPDGIEQARLEFAVLAYDADGKVINATERAFGLDLPPEIYAQVMSGGFPQHQEIDLPAGQVFLRIVVHDLGSSLIGATEIPLMVAKK